MSPKGVLLDFEEALADGFVKVFPDAAVLADFFHFVSYCFSFYSYLFLILNIGASQCQNHAETWVQI